MVKGYNQTQYKTIMTAAVAFVLHMGRENHLCPSACACYCIDFYVNRNETTAVIPRRALEQLSL